MALSARGKVATMAEISAGSTNGGVTQASPPAPSALPFGIDFNSPHVWVCLIFGASVLYLLGAYVMLGRYRVAI